MAGPPRPVVARVGATMAEGRARVLVADDEGSLRELLVEALLESGCEVVAVGDGREALRLLLGAGPYDLVVLDEEMPGLSGRRVLTAARSAGLDVPAILWSGSLELDDGERAALGVSSFLRKPVAIEVLHEAIRLALGRPPVG